jgi:hypothetical protein
MTDEKVPESLIDIASVDGVEPGGEKNARNANSAMESLAERAEAVRDVAAARELISELHAELEATRARAAALEGEPAELQHDGVAMVATMDFMLAPGRRCRAGDVVGAFVPRFTWLTEKHVGKAFKRGSIRLLESSE